MVKVYTKGGDKGSTSLFGGSRISKSSPRVRTYGTIDTANTSLGLARAHIENKTLNDLLRLCQLKLFQLAAEIASDPKGIDQLKNKIVEKDVSFLENIIDELNKDLSPKPYFMIPGSSKSSAFLHGARADVRAAERELVDLSMVEDLNPQAIKFVNRLSDLMFIMSRYVDEVLGQVNISKEVNTLDMDLAKKIIEASLVKAKEIKVPMAISIVDKSGNLIAFNKMDDTLVASIGISQDKAYTAATLKTSTELLGETAQPRKELYGIGNRDRIVIFGGGLPLFYKGQLLGGIGVSGGAVSEDIQVAKAGLDFFENREV